MSEIKFFSSQPGSLRQGIMASVGAMVLLSLLSSTVSLYRITEVNRLLEAINHVSVPLGRLFAQMRSDAEVYHREVERSLGDSHWKDSRWRPRPSPRWIEDILVNEMFRVNDLIKSDSEWTGVEARAHWREWAKHISLELTVLNSEVAQLYEALEQKNETSAAVLYSKWSTSLNEWKRQIQWGSTEYERSLRQNFSTTEGRVGELQTGLEIILIIVVLMSLLLVWLSERAIRPLGELTRLARDITRRGLKKEDKSLLSEIPISRSDEVSQLAREFHHMATALLEREKTVESQKHRLQEQNRLLRDIGELNENILNSIESILIVTDLCGKVTQCNPEALRWLGGAEGQVRGAHLMALPGLKEIFEEVRGGAQWLESLKKTAAAWKLGPVMIDGKVYGGQVMPLRGEKGDPHGAILVLDDLTEEMDLQERLRQAENLAAVGRMSAQVAHEVRNPLHSIGLEAEMAVEMASRLGNAGLKQSLQSILGSVDRLQKITENYLKLSRLSDGQKSRVDLGMVLESVLALYAPVCDAQQVQVDWRRESRACLKVWADYDLLEQVLGNLFRNSLQALENGVPNLGKVPQINWSLGESEGRTVWLKIEDNGPGIASEIKDRLFVPFVTTRVHGTGLGLSFIKKVLEDHGGTIRNLDRPLGQGACFELTLPLMDQSQVVYSKEDNIYAENIAR